MSGGGGWTQDRPSRLCRDGCSESAGYDVAAAAAEFYASYQLELELSQAPAVEVEFGLDGSKDQFANALLAAGLPSEQDLTEEEIRRTRDVIGHKMLIPLTRFLDLPTSPRDGLTLLVAREVASPQLRDFLALDGDLVGLGIPPATIIPTTGMMAQGELQPFFAEARIDRGVAIVSQSKLQSLPRGRENVVSHELGHALGLAHNTGCGNLMHPRVELDCRPCMVAAQVEMIRTQW